MKIELLWKWNKGHLSRNISKCNTSLLVVMNHHVVSKIWYYRSMIFKRSLHWPSCLSHAKWSLTESIQVMFGLSLSLLPSTFPTSFFFLVILVSSWYCQSYDRIGLVVLVSAENGNLISPSINIFLFLAAYDIYKPQIYHIFPNSFPLRPAFTFIHKIFL